MLADVVRDLMCPLCRGDLAIEGGTLRCPAGHAYDIARQGYVNLLPGGARPSSADSAAMVAAREAFLGAGHFAALTARLALLVARTLGEAGTPGPAGGALVVDAGAGTGHYLRAVLDRSPGARGLALDLSKFALRRAVRAHPGIGAAVVDLWSAVPVRTGAAEIVMNVFAPRNGPEFQRILRPDGRLFVVTPTAAHLRPLVERLGLLSVDDRKAERVAGSLGGSFAPEHREIHQTVIHLDHTGAESLIGMGPSARHVAPARLRAELGRMTAPIPVTISYTIALYRPVR